MKVECQGKSTGGASTIISRAKGKGRITKKKNGTILLVQKVLLSIRSATYTHQ